MYPLESAAPEAAEAQAAAAAAAAEDRRLVAGLRGGDEAVYAELVRRWHPAMLRVARMYVRDRSVAEEVVQETWLAVLQGVDRFEARSSLKTWVFRILTNRAKTRGHKDPCRKRCAIMIVLQPVAHREPGERYRDNEREEDQLYKIHRQQVPHVEHGGAQHLSYADLFFPLFGDE